MASGMGMPSIGIYSFELYNFYDVDTIVRIGSAGSYDESLGIFDTVLVTEAYSDSSYAKVGFGIKSKTLKPSSVINNKLRKAADKLNIKLTEGRIYSTDCFYSTNPSRWKDYHDNKGCIAVEMESFSLFANAKVAKKKAACLLTISDSLVTGVETTSKERVESLQDMIKVALELASN